MRKNDLIKKLQEIEGNPEVVLWNGMVGDYVHIGELVNSFLVKEEKKHWLEMIRLSRCQDLNDYSYQIPEQELKELDKLYSERQYEMNEYVTTEDIKY